ncbi:peptidoglycan-associated lipoprotein [Syntrophus gentianae]|uniref:Peptidoglycan-associated lipoprotein n=1 Tax=Syntrophus gentianae TaxID=43775 RepID=A0A1H7YP41_9BACT|nr:peptidoglycan-associated lipoprotein Pal [Syntrophus gentianae]SEM47067.1 peptidoglycan-associated lipoprotein [Syntrophus gentianae]
MVKTLRTLGVLISLLFLTFVFTAGCAKKQTIQEGTGVAKPAGVEVKAATGKPGPTPEELAALEKEKALKEQTLRQQAEKERLAREEAEKERLEKERLEKEKAAAEAEKAAQAKGEGPLADIHFEFDQFSLTSEARGLLQKHAAWLSTHSGNSVLIEGHCDDRGTTEYNLALGERRAAETLKFLAALGINRSRMKTVSYGEEMPLDPAETEAAWAKNRRVHFVVNPKK